ncbi:MAG: helix-turn-helix domain-containing protein [Rhodothermales bacterium]|nr:helix-turn-helix domain-containing protein [Rhodothermales bacterium]
MSRTTDRPPTRRATPTTHTQVLTSAEDLAALVREAVAGAERPLLPPDPDGLAGLLAGAQRGRYLNAAAVAAYLGVRPRTLENYRKAGLPAHRFEGVAGLFYVLAEVDVWLAARRVEGL